MYLKEFASDLCRYIFLNFNKVFNCNHSILVSLNTIEFYHYVFKQMHHSMLFFFSLFTFPFQPLPFCLVPFHPVSNLSLRFLSTHILFPFLTLLPIKTFPPLQVSILLSCNICTCVNINPDPPYEIQPRIFVFCVKKYLTYATLYKRFYSYPQWILCLKQMYLDAW